MKNSIKAIIAVAALSFGGLAHAVPFFSGTVGGWSGLPVHDSEFDSDWSVLAFSPALAGASVTLDENELLGVDYYSVELSGLTLQNTSASMTYRGAQTGGDQVFRSAHLDSTHVGDGVTVTSQVYEWDPVLDVVGNLLVTLTSTNGLTDEAFYAPQVGIHVVETYTVGAGGILTGTADTFDVHVPVPFTPALLGLGMFGLGWMRRRKVA